MNSIDYIIENIYSIDVIRLRMIFFQMRLLAHSIYGKSTQPSDVDHNDYIRLRNALITSGRIKEIIE